MATPGGASPLPAEVMARIFAKDATPWIPLFEGVSFQPLRFLTGNRGFVTLLRLTPRAAIPMHRHTGEVHAFNVEGARQLGSGELIGPGDYTYEPAGNIDTWKAVGETPLVVLTIVMGVVEYLGPDNTVRACSSTETLMAAYQKYCNATGIAPLDLID